MKQVHLLIEIIAFTFPLWGIGQGSPILLCSEKYWESPSLTLCKIKWRLEIVWKWKERVGDDGEESAAPKWCDLVKVAESNSVLMTYIEDPFLFNIHWSPLH